MKIIAGIKRLATLSSLIGLALVIQGCATSTSKIPVDTNTFTNKNQPSATQSVFIQTVNDIREFEAKPATPDIPSPGYTSETEKDHAIGRKRNSVGKALGKINLPDNQGVKQVVKGALESALIDNGWKVLTDESEITAETKIINVDIKKFWEWMELGVFTITLNCNIETTVNNDPLTDEPITIFVKYNEDFVTAKNGNWKVVLQGGVNQFIGEAKLKLSKAN